MDKYFILNCQCIHSQFEKAKVSDIGMQRFWDQKFRICGKGSFPLFLNLKTNGELNFDKSFSNSWSNGALNMDKLFFKLIKQWSKEYGKKYFKLKTIGEQIDKLV